MDCNHKWRGTAEGVECALCGKKMTAAEYVAATNKTDENKKRGRKAKADE